MATPVTPGPLTTIFTPPAGCFQTLPEAWQPCGVIFTEGESQTRCYWSLPSGCYPTSAQIYSAPIWGLDDATYYNSVYRYSPGVLPSGFANKKSQLETSSIEYSSGCWSGWDFEENFCTSLVAGRWVSGTVTTSGSFKGVLPRVDVTWASSDLFLFTPASAPALPTESLDQYISSVAAHSRSMSNLAQPTQTQSSPAPPPSQAPPSDDADSGLSTGAQAGIGAGVGIAALIVLFGLGFWFYRRKMRKVNNQSSQDQFGGAAYYRNPAELPNSVMQPKELSAEFRGVHNGANAPFVPVDSKPRLRTELA